MASSPCCNHEHRSPRQRHTLEADVARLAGVLDFSRIVQVGDSAHSFLPFSGNGASRAMEDGITIAACLQLGGKSNVGISTKVYNKLR